MEKVQPLLHPQGEIDVDVLHLIPSISILQTEFIPSLVGQGRIEVEFPQKPFLGTVLEVPPDIDVLGGV
jgi:hypothetical protein